MLYIFSGLPASGKSTLAKILVAQTKAAYFRIDTIEQGIRDLCSVNVRGEGYRLAYRIIEDNLRLGNDVIADSCNPWDLTRREWEETATRCGATFLNIEIICSDIEEHQKRIQKRKPEIEGLKLPGWEEIKNRKYDEWKEEHIIIDTAKKTIKDCTIELLKKIEEAKHKFE